MRITERILDRIFKTFLPPPKEIFEGKPKEVYELKGNGFDFGGRNGGKTHGVELYENAIVWPRFSAVMDSSRRLVAQTMYDQKRQERVRRNLFRYPTKYIKGYATSIDFLWSGYNHYHQLIDLHSRLWSLRHKSLADIPVTLLHCYDWREEYIELMREIAPNVTFERVSRRLRYRVEHYLHLPFLSRSLLPHLTQEVSSIGYLPVEFFQFHQSETERIFPSTRKFSKFIYISRKQAKQRRVINEERLEKELTDLGFETVCFDKMSLADQFGAMREARVIVGLHGAGMANILSAKMRPFYLEVWSGYHGFHPCLSAAADFGHIKYAKVHGDSQHIHDDFHAPIKEILDYVKPRLV